MTDYINNLIYQELINKDNRFDVKSDERIYLDLRATSGYVKETENWNKSTQKLLSTFY